MCVVHKSFTPPKKKFRRAERAENFFWEGWVHSNFRGVLFQNELNFSIGGVLRPEQLLGGGYFGLKSTFGHQGGRSPIFRVLGGGYAMLNYGP